MKNHLALFFVFFYTVSIAQNADTLHVSNFGAHPYSYENSIVKIQATIDECKRTGVKVLSFENGRISLYGEGWRSNKNHCIQYDPQRETFIYSNDWDLLATLDAQETAPQTVRFKTSAEFLPKEDNTIIDTQTLRPRAENTSTFYLNGCKDVAIRGNTFEEYTPKQRVKTENMKSKYLKMK